MYIVYTAYKVYTDTLQLRTHYKHTCLSSWQESWACVLSLAASLLILSMLVLTTLLLLALSFLTSQLTPLPFVVVSAWIKMRSRSCEKSVVARERTERALSTAFRWSGDEVDSR